MLEQRFGAFVSMLLYLNAFHGIAGLGPRDIRVNSYPAGTLLVMWPCSDDEPAQIPGCGIVLEYRSLLDVQQFSGLAW